LGGTTAVAAGFPSIVRAQTLGLGGPAPSARLNVGFVGGGGISGGHIDHVLKDPSLQLVSICDVDRLVLEKRRAQISKHYAELAGTTSFAGPSTHTDFLELVNDPSIDALFVCTPDHWHALVLIHAARAGKSVYCEKPLSRTAAEGLAMVEAVRRSGVVCQIGSQQRSSREFQRAITLVRNGSLGRIRRVQVGLPGGGGVQQIVSTAGQPVPATLDYERWVGPSPFLPYVEDRLHWNWRWCYEFAGGQLTDWINHHYDIAQVALGLSDELPVAIRDASAVFHTNPIYNTATSYSFTAHYAGGQVIEVSSSYPMGIRFEGEEGWLHVNRGIADFSNPALRSAPLPSQGFSIDGGLSNHRQNFFDCIKSRARTRSPIDQAHKTAMVAHLANSAMRAGLSEVRWDAAAGRIAGAPAAERFLSPTYRSPWHLPA
jgi:predicted dehydrogenase